MNIISCNKLTKEYMSGDSVIKAVDNISVEFEQAEFCAITGPSGSGKSTLLHMLSSLENPTSGYVLYNDAKLGDYSDNQLSILRRRRFGFVFQAYNLVNELTGMENILLPIMLDSKKADEKYLDKEAKAYVGKYDYSGFCSSKSDVEDTVREIYSFDVWREGDLVFFKVSGDGFLYNMVRIMVGTLLFVSQGKIKENELKSVIDSKDRKRAGRTAPPQGLYLNKIVY